MVWYACGERLREFGIRLALGTTPSRLRGRLLWETFITVGCGAVVGMTLASIAGRSLQHLIPGAGAGMAVTATLAVLGTITVAAAATWSATRRVAKLDIMEVLRPDDGA